MKFFSTTAVALLACTAAAQTVTVSTFKKAACVKSSAGPKVVANASTECTNFPKSGSIRIHFSTEAAEGCQFGFYEKPNCNGDYTSYYASSSQNACIKTGTGTSGFVGCG